LIGVPFAAANITISKVKNIINIIKINGKNTKNHATVLYPDSHKKFKNHVHKKTNIIFVTIVNALICQAIDTIAINDISKYISAGGQYNLDAYEFVAVNEDIIKNT
jgi:hypothetical protein